MENGSSSLKEGNDVRLKHTTQIASKNVEETISVSSPGGHKRTLSGNILSKFPFLRPSTEVDNAAVNISEKDGTYDELANYRSPGGALASAIQHQKKTRKRKGSLRKTALLGTGKIKLEGRERKATTSETPQPARSPLNQSVNAHNTLNSLTYQASLEEDIPTPRQSYEKSLYTTSKAKESQSGDTAYKRNPSEENVYADGLIRQSTHGDLSTTDEDDTVTFKRSPNLISGPSIPKAHSSSGSDSYFPSVVIEPQRRRSTNKSKSPLGTLAVEPITSHEEWDYSETEWWGWVVLIVTWLVFVVGMGSCFGVWSWAWDVGETPQAPPELSDDPTLPIVGYYPALIILTAVMAWVWVVIAWIGMKYFKHAKISG